MAPVLSVVEGFSLRRVCATGQIRQVDKGWDQLRKRQAGLGLRRSQPFGWTLTTKPALRL